jgi:hypothetical protein
MLGKRVRTHKSFGSRPCKICGRWLTKAAGVRASHMRAHVRSGEAWLASPFGYAVRGPAGPEWRFKP